MALDPLTILFLNCHQAVREIVKEKTGKYPKEYKKIEQEHINKFLTNISYKGKNYLDFISYMMSSLIVIHGLSNTNHRSTILFTSIILNEMGIKFPSYDSSEEKERWIIECNHFIEGSKKILNDRKKDPKYSERHLEWTKEWLGTVTDHQSISSGMMSFHLLSSLRKIPSSDLFSLSVIK
jgi:hypothetical protein